jgi:hypothetical protein
VRRSVWFLEKWRYDLLKLLRRAAYRIELRYVNLREVLLGLRSRGTTVVADRFIATQQMLDCSALLARRPRWGTKTFR